MTELSLVQAVNAALKHAMNENVRVLVLGEDGGVFRATEGLFKIFGATITLSNFGSIAGRHASLISAF